MHLSMSRIEPDSVTYFLNILMLLFYEDKLSVGFVFFRNYWDDDRTNIKRLVNYETKIFAFSRLLFLLLLMLKTFLLSSKDE